MLRRILVTASVALAGVATFGGVASADVYPGAPGVVAVGVAPSDTDVAAGELFDLLFGGFGPDEIVKVVGTYDPGPPRLRTTPAPPELSSPLIFTVTVGHDGSLSLPVEYRQQGYITFVATGRTSSSVTVRVGAGSPSSAVSGADAGSSDSPGELAYTGKDSTVSNLAGAKGDDISASVVGPFATAVVAMLAGLALLFLGMRTVRGHVGAHRRRRQLLFKQFRKPTAERLTTE